MRGPDWVLVVLVRGAVDPAGRLVVFPVRLCPPFPLCDCALFDFGPLFPDLSECADGLNVVAINLSS